MLFHYVSYNTAQEAECAQRLARQSLYAEQDRIQGAGKPIGDLYLGGEFWYVFHTHQPLSFDQVKRFMSTVPSCGHALNIAQPYW